MMFRKVYLVTIIATLGILTGSQGYGQDAGNLAAALDKNKYKKKDKSTRGIDISLEVYVDIKNAPVVKPAADYSGKYAAEGDDFTLDLRVAADGTAEGSGFDSIYSDKNHRVAFTLKRASVNGAVLTGDKVFADGHVERFEAVFVNRTIVTGKNEKEIDKRETAFGLGFIQNNSGWTNRVFLISK